MLLVSGAEGIQVKFSQGLVIFTAFPDYSSSGSPCVSFPPHTSPPQAPLVFCSLVDTKAGPATPQIQTGLGMTSLPSPISSVINIWLCLISYKDNRGEDGMRNVGRKRARKTEKFPPSCRQTEGTLNYTRAKTCNNG